MWRHSWTSPKLKTKVIFKWAEGRKEAVVVADVVAVVVVAAVVVVKVKDEVSVGKESTLFSWKKIFSKKKILRKKIYEMMLNDEEKNAEKFLLLNILFSFLPTLFHSKYLKQKIL